MIHELKKTSSLPGLLNLQRFIFLEPEFILKSDGVFASTLHYILILGFSQEDEQLYFHLIENKSYSK